MERGARLMSVKSTIAFQCSAVPFMLLTLVACSGGASNTLCVPSGSTTVASNLALNLSPSIASEETAAYGTGFVDINTTDASGVAISKRCTMTLRAIDDSDTTVRVWTAGHCTFDPQTVEFKNSKPSLRIAYKKRYFTVPVEFDGFESLSKFADFVNGLLVRTAIPDLDRHLGSALPSSAHEVCIKQEEKFREQLGTRAQNIACFTRDEMRGLKARLSPDKNVQGLLKMVLAELRKREAATMNALDDNLKKAVSAYLISHTTEQRRIADLRSLAYNLNKTYCETAPADRPPADADGPTDMASGCAFRAMALSKLQEGLAVQDYKVIDDIVNDTTTPLTDLRRKTMGCNGVSVNTIASVSDVSRLTPCDMGNLSKTFWRTYVDKGPYFSGTQETSSLFGFSGTNYFGFYTNTQLGTATPRAARFSLNGTVVSDFEYAERLDSGKSLNHDVFLVNYDAGAQGINPVKGASGSILSIFGSIPAALLSTVDGEATSGGAGVTPLPEISDDDVQPTSNAGC